MGRKTNADKILELLARSPGLDDDEISRLAEISPRQTVNQECRLLAAQGLVRREKEPGRKIVNYLVDQPSAPQDSPTNQRLKVEASSVEPPTIRPYQRGERREAKASTLSVPLIPVDLERTLILIPCSGDKDTSTDTRPGGKSFTSGLPSDLVGELEDAREAVATHAELDEQFCLPAFERYSGTLYGAASAAIGDAAAKGTHILIISGGYGILHASEPIGRYDKTFAVKDWPNQILERCLLAYVRLHNLKHVRGFVSQTTDYRKVINRTDWASAGIEDAVLVMPEKAGGAMIKAPATQGEALVEMLEMRLVTNWVGSYGLGLECSQLAP